MKIIPIFSKFEYYKSIDDFPIDNWLKVQEKNDLRYLLLKFRDITKKETKQLEIAVQIMTDQYIDTFGISDEYRKSLTLKRDIRVLEIEYITTGDRSKLTMMQYKRSQLRRTIKLNNKNSVSEVKMHVSKFMGFQVNFKTMPVKEFYTILKSIIKESKTKTA